MAAAASLSDALAQLSLSSKELSGSAFDTRVADEENGIYREAKPRQRNHQNAADLKEELEQEFLNPSARFGSEWLNRLQRSV